MQLSERDKQVIKHYETEEEMMVLIFVQWCKNNEIDPLQLYVEAYPEQGENKLLKRMMEHTVTKMESTDITTNVVLHVLQNFGNEDLAFIVQEKAAEKKLD